MTSDFAGSLVFLIKNGSISLEHVKRWVKTRHSNGSLTNLEYLEITVALDEYEQGHG